MILVLFLCSAALSRIEVDAVGYPDKYVAVCDPVVLGYAHADVESDARCTVSSRIRYCAGTLGNQHNTE